MSPIGSRIRSSSLTTSSVLGIVNTAFLQVDFEPIALSTAHLHWVDYEFISFCTTKGLSVNELYSVLDSVNRYFPGAVSKEALLYDPEDETTHAVISVHLDTNVIEARRKLRAFDNEWWLHQPNNIRNTLTVKLEF
ncbi:hypothetical protein HUU59_06195 [bacterium]|nr:hypothetical protein [bacterium]